MFDRPCRHDPELFFSKYKRHQEEAIKVCMTMCKQLESCREETAQLEQQLGSVLHGVRAGTTDKERRRTFQCGA